MTTTISSGFLIAKVFVFAVSSKMRKTVEIFEKHSRYNYFASYFFLKLLYCLCNYYSSPERIAIFLCWTICYWCLAYVICQSNSNSIPGNTLYAKYLDCCSLFFPPVVFCITSEITMHVCCYPFVVHPFLGRNLVPGL